MKHATPHRLVLLQQITVRWEKASRGAPGAVARNHVPEVHALPATPPTLPWPSRFQYSAPTVLPLPDPADDRPPDLYLHLVSYSAQNQFHSPVVQYWTALVSRLPESCILRLPHRNVPPLTLAGVTERLQVEFSWDPEVGAPPRSYRHRQEQVLLAAGQWMQVRYNGRHIYHDDGTWYYEKHVFNIGFADAFVPTLFVAGPPDHQITDFADLH